MKLYLYRVAHSTLMLVSIGALYLKLITAKYMHRDEDLFREFLNDVKTQRASPVNIINTPKFLLLKRMF